MIQNVLQESKTIALYPLPDFGSGPLRQRLGEAFRRAASKFCNVLATRGREPKNKRLARQLFLFLRECDFDGLTREPFFSYRDLKPGYEDDYETALAESLREKNLVFRVRSSYRDSVRDLPVLPDGTVELSLPMKKIVLPFDTFDRSLFIPVGANARFLVDFGARKIVPQGAELKAVAELLANGKKKPETAANGPVDPFADSIFFTSQDHPRKRKKETSSDPKDDAKFCHRARYRGPGAGFSSVAGVRAA